MLKALIHLDAKSDSITLKAEVDKLDSNSNLVNVPTFLNNLTTNVDDLDVGKLKTIPIDPKNLSNVVNKKIYKKTKFNKVNMKVNNLENKIPDASTLIQTNQYNPNKINLEKKNRDAENIIPDISGLVTTTVLNTKIGEIENKYQILVV